MKKQKKKMKKNEIFLLLFLLILYSCATTEYWKLKMEIPGKSTADLDSYKNVILTNFLELEETKGFDINDEILDYFSYEIEQTFKNNVSTKTVSLEEDVFENENFWKNLSEDSEKTVYITGTVKYTEETRKALLKREKRQFQDPFPSQTKLAKRSFYTLLLDLYLIEAGTGKTLYSRKFKETKSYKNPNQTAYFAFFDLIQAIKDKLIDDVLGKEKIEERYLIK